MTILLIDENGVKLGQVDLKDANQMAYDKKLKLVLVNQKNNVYKLVDHGKIEYDRKQKNKKQKAQQRLQKIKEIQLTPSIDLGDLEVKINKIQTFLKQGLRTKLVMKFKKSQINYKDLALQKVNSVVDKLMAQNLVSIDGPPEFKDNAIYVFLKPKKDKV